VYRSVKRDENVETDGNRIIKDLEEIARNSILKERRVMEWQI
jgi:hypothetical protein